MTGVTVALITLMEMKIRQAYTSQFSAEFTPSTRPRALWKWLP